MLPGPRDRLPSDGAEGVEESDMMVDCKVDDPRCFKDDALSKRTDG